MLKRFLSLSIRIHLVILISLLAFPFITIIVHLGINERYEAIAAARRENMKFVAIIANEQRSLVAGVEQLVIALSFLPELQTRNVEATNAILVQLLEKNPQLTNIAVMDTKGMIWGTATPFQGQLSLGDRKYFIEAVRTGEFSSGEYTVGRISTKPIINFGYPVKDRWSQPIAIIGVALDLEYIRSDFKKMSLPAGSSFRVLDHMGITLIGDFEGNHPDAFTGRREISPQVFKSMEEGAEEGTFEGIGIEGDFRLFTYRKISLPREMRPYLYILSSVPRDAIVSRASSAMLKNLSALAFVFLGGLIMAWFIGKHAIVERINMLKAASQKLAKGVETVNVSNIVRGGELGELALAFDEMAKAIVERETAKNSAEAALLESEGKFRDLSEKSIVSIYLLQDDLVKYANGTFAETFGYDIHEVIDRVNPKELVHPEDWPRMEENLRKMISGDLIAAHDEFRISTRRGEIRHVAAYNSRTIYQGKPAIIGTLLDTTDRMLIQDELKAVLQKNQNALQIACMGLWELDMTTRVFTFNDQYYSLHGLTARETGGYRMASDEYARKYVHPEDAHLVNDSIETAAATNDPEFQLQQEVRILRADGQPRVVSLWFRVEKDVQGKTVKLHGVNQDITDRKRAEETLRQSEEFLSSIVENIPDMIFIKDAKELRFLRFNKAGEELLGYDRADLFGKNDHDFFPKEQADLFTKRDREVLESGQTCDIPEEPIDTKKGRRILHTTKIPIMDKNGKPAYLLGISEDITERRQAEAEREKLQAQLSQAQKMESVGRLAGGVAHDFNNMLSAILGHAQLAMMRSNPSERTYQDLKAIEKSAHRSADLIRQLLAFARKQTVAPKVLELNDTVGGMLKMLRRLIGEDIGFAWMPGADLWPVKLDPSQIDQLLTNLCVNARDAIAGVGKVTIETKNTAFDEAYCAVHSGFVPGEYVALTVSDDGCGMDKDCLDHIFEPFFTTKEVGKGTGLGLATVYGIVKQNDGFVNVISEPGEGSTFTIYLRRFVGQAMEPTTESPVELPKGHGETVLLVEDETLILHATRAMLEELGYKVLTADTPVEALRQVKAHSGEIQLLITDVIMPEMNGRDLANSLTDIRPSLKCLFASGYPANVIAHRGVLDEGVHFIPKPFSMQSLAVKVREALERE
jgi:PAS domain S-box-containing protein